MKHSVLIISEHQESADLASALSLERRLITWAKACCIGDLSVKMRQGVFPDVFLVDEALLMWPLRLERTLAHTRGIPKLIVGDGKLRSIVAAAQGGAGGYVCRCAPPAEIAEAINHVFSGARFVLPACLNMDEENLPCMQPTSSPVDHGPIQDGFTRREREVLPLLLEGLTNRQLGEQLCISIETAKYHVENILRKLGLKHRLQLKLQARAKALTEPKMDCCPFTGGTRRRASC